MKRNLLLAVFTLMTVTLAYGQRQITGQVTSTEDGGSLPGVSVIVKGTIIGTTTNFDGQYSLDVPDNYNVLVFSFIGMKTKEVPIGATTSLNVALDPDVLGLDEVVVTAVGIERSTKALGYSVQEIDGDQVASSRETNVVSGLSAKVSGVTINKSSGAAGSSAFIAIRGLNTINGNNQPIFVVDGVPIDNSQLSSGNPDDGANAYLSSVANSNRVIDLNPEDIASITVLKGAAATALYGSQAGNGAVIITTKRGNNKKKGLNIDFSTGFDVNTYNKAVPLQDEYAQGVSGIYQGPQTGYPLSWGPKLDTMVYQPDPTFLWDKNGRLVGQSANPGGTPANAYDNWDNFFRPGTTYQANLGLSGASEKASYYLSLGRLTESGIIPHNTFERTNISFNGDLIVNKNLKVGSSVKYIRSGGNRIEQGSNISGVMLGLVRTPPSFDNSNGYGQDAADNEDAYMFPDGRQRAYRSYGTYDNPFWTAARNPLRDVVDRVIGHVTATYQFAPWISASYKIGSDIYSDNRKQHFSINSATARPGKVTENNFYSRRFNEDLIVYLNPEVNDKIGVNITLGSNRRSAYLQQLYAQGDGLAIPNFYHISNTASQFVRESVNRSRDQALFGMAEFEYDGMLYVTVTGRSEWSTTLPEEENPFFYPSISASFIFTEAFGLQDNNILPFGKFRISYAQVGLGSPYLYATDNYYTQAFFQDGWTNGVVFPFGGLNGFSVLNSLGNPTLRPERNDQFEVGFDLRFLNNRLGVDVTYYSAVSNDLIFPVPIARSSGSSFAVLNSGKMTNKGIELLINATPVKTKDFTWDMTFNFSRNENMVVELAEGVDNVLVGGFLGSSIRAVAGNPYGSIFGFGFYRDASGAMVIGEDGFPIMDPEEKGFGSAQPDWLLGIRNQFSFKGFTLSALLDIRQGGSMWNGTKGALYYFGTHEGTEIRGTTKVFEGNVVTRDGNGDIVLDSEGHPVTSGSNTQEVVLDENWLAFNNGNGFFGDNTEDFIESTSWVRLREVTLSYQLPGSMVENTPFTGVSIYVTGRNVFLSTPYTGIDPETSLVGSRNAQGMDYFNMPNTKSWGAGVRITL